MLVVLKITGLSGISISRERFASISSSMAVNNDSDTILRCSIIFLLDTAFVTWSTSVRNRTFFVAAGDESRLLLTMWPFLCHKDDEDAGP